MSDTVLGLLTKDNAAEVDSGILTITDSAKYA